MFKYLTQGNSMTTIKQVKMYVEMMRPYHYFGYDITFTAAILKRMQVTKKDRALTVKRIHSVFKVYALRKHMEKPRFKSATMRNMRNFGNLSGMRYVSTPRNTGKTLYGSAIKKVMLGKKADYLVMDDLLDAQKFLNEQGVPNRDPKTLDIIRNGGWPDEEDKD
jgi:hypothetical protein